MSTIPVYHFTSYIGMADEKVTSKRMATMDFIRRVGGTPIQATEKIVEISELDGGERYPKTSSNTTDE